MHQIKGSIFHNGISVIEDVNMHRALRFDDNWHCHFNASVEELALFQLNQKYHAIFSDGKQGDMIFNSIGSLRELFFGGIKPLS